MANPDSNPHFPDLARWPETPPPIGHNRPPLETSVLLDFDEAIARKGLAARVAEIAEAAKRAPDVDAETVGAAGDLVAQAKAATEAVGAEREVLNRPLLDAQRGLKSRADGLLAPMATPIGELRAKLDAFMAEHAEVAHGDMGTRVGKREVWEFKIVDLGKLPLDIRRHEEVIAAIEKVIRARVRSGTRAIPGVKIWSSQKATVR
jgi:hypothetical protein